MYVTQYPKRRMPHSQKISASTSHPLERTHRQVSVERYFNRRPCDDNESKKLPLKKRRKLNNVVDEKTPSLSREPVSSQADTEKSRALTHKEVEQEGESS